MNFGLNEETLKARSCPRGAWTVDYLSSFLKSILETVRTLLMISVVDLELYHNSVSLIL